MFPILSPGQLSANLVEIYINLASQHFATTLLPLIHLPEAISLHTISKIFVYFSSENGKSFRGLVFVKKQNISHFFCEGFPYLFEELVKLFPTNMSVTNIVSFPNNNSTSTLTLLSFSIFSILSLMIKSTISRNHFFIWDLLALSFSPLLTLKVKCQQMHKLKQQFLSLT